MVNVINYINVINYTHVINYTNIEERVVNYMDILVNCFSKVL